MPRPAALAPLRRRSFLLLPRGPVPIPSGTNVQGVGAAPGLQGALQWVTAALVTNPWLAGRLPYRAVRLDAATRFTARNL